MADEKFTVVVDVELAEGAGQKLKSQIETALKGKPVKISVEADTNNISKEIKSDMTQIGKAGGQAISKGLNQGIAQGMNKVEKEARDVTEEFEQMLKLANRINSLTSNMARGVTSKGTKVTEAGLKKQQAALDKALSEFGSYYNQYAKNLSEKEVAKLNAAAGSKIDKTGQTEVGYKRLNSILKETYELQKKLADAKFAGDTDGIKKQQQAIQKLDAEYDDLYVSIEKNLTLMDKFYLQKSRNDNESSVDKYESGLNQKLINEQQKLLNKLDSTSNSGSTGAQKYSKDLEELRQKIIACNNSADLDNLSSEFARLGTQIKSADKDVTDTFKRIKSAINQINSLKIDNAKMAAKDPIGNANQIEANEAAIKDLRNAVKELKTELGTGFSDTQMNELSDGARKTKIALSQVEAEAQDVKQALYAALKTNAGSGLEADIEDVTKKIQLLTTTSSGLDKAFDELTASAAAVRQAIKNVENGEGNIEDAIAAQYRFNSALEETNRQYRINAAHDQSSASYDKVTNAAKKLEQQKKIFSLQVDTWLKKNSAAEAEFGARLRELQAQLSRVDATGLDNLKREFKILTAEAQNAGQAHMNFGDKLNAQWARYASYISVATLSMEAMQALRMMFQETLKVDTAMTELKRVTDLSADGYNQLYDSMIASAKEYGAVLSDVINQTADWSRAGFNAAESLDLAEITTMYQKVAGVTNEIASENLLTTYQGFQKSFEDESLYDFGDDATAAVSHVMDVLNELDK